MSVCPFPYTPFFVVPPWHSTTCPLELNTTDCKSLLPILYYSRSRSLIRGSDVLLFCCFISRLSKCSVSCSTILFIGCCSFVLTTVDVRWLNIKSSRSILLSQRTSSVFFLNVLPRPKSYLYLYFSIRDTVGGTVNCTSQQNITYLVSLIFL
jgi:hypothetical protein